MKWHYVLLLLTVQLLVTHSFINAQQLELFTDANGKYGYRNPSGVVMVPAKYQKAHSLAYYDLAAIKFNNKWGFINREGKEIIPPRFDSVGKYLQSFSSGNIEVMLNGKWGIINEQGKEVVPVKYQDVRNEYTNRFPVKQNNKWGFMENGKETIPIKYEKVQYFERGIAPVLLNKKWGAVDSTGKTVIPFKYDDLFFVYQVREPLNWLRAKYKSKWGYVATNGTETIPFKYDAIKDYRINYSTEKPMDTTKLEEMGSFMFNDLEMVQLGGKWGAIDVKGNEIIPIKYDDILNEWNSETFIIGFQWFRVKLNNKWGLIDAAGNELIAARYPSALFTYNADAIKKISDAKNKQATVDVSKQPEANNSSHPLANPPKFPENGSILISSVKPLNNIKLWPNRNMVVTTQTIPGMKGIVDPDLVGTWKFRLPGIKLYCCYTFKADGTYSYWLDPADPDLLISCSSFNCHWRINGDDLELLEKGSTQVQHLKIAKAIGTETNKPELLIEFSGGYYRVYLSTL
ncbi:MAG TPA: WG repeat-containing protein [Chitinophagaceae bacterium]|nr:WG repeat-containing protein [Chitinophagaceae bacterium]